MRKTPLLKSTAVALLMVVCGVLSFLAAPAYAAQPDWYDGETQQCSNLSTMGMVECLANLTRDWDARLNKGYQKMMSLLPNANKTKLRVAQRLWIKYRDANCGYYAAGEGTIARVETAECLRFMTASRANELEQMLRP